MHDLRLVGVHEDGLHLLLSDGDGGRYRVPLDESLRAAVRRDRPHLGQLQIEIEGGLRPREVQALIRSGLSTQEVADRAGWTPEKVRRYEGPILAEREYVSGLAQQVRLRDRQAGSNATLRQRVEERLRGRGVEPHLAAWDSARNAEGQWRITVEFPAGGRERSATWWFDAEGRSVVPADDEARWLSEDSDQGNGPIPHNPAFGPSATVYDVDAEGGIDQVRRKTGRRAPTDIASTLRETSTRRRRGTRRNQPTLTPVDDAPREDALPLESVDFDPETAAPPPAVRGLHPLDAEPQAPSPAEVAAEVEVTEIVEEPSTPAEDSLAPEAAAGGEPDAPDAVADQTHDPETASIDEDPVEDGTAVEPDPAPAEDVAEPSADADALTETHAEAEASIETADDPEAAATAVPDAESVPAQPAEAAPRPAPPRKGRRSVPSWDDIMFGPGSGGSSGS